MVATTTCGSQWRLDARVLGSLPLHGLGSTAPACSCRVAVSVSARAHLVVSAPPALVRSDVASHEFNFLITDLPFALRTAMEKNRLLGPCGCIRV